MKKHICVTLTAVAILGIGSAVASAEGKNRGDELKQRIQAKTDELIEKLKLAPSVETQVRQIFQTHHQAMANWHREHGKEFRELAEQHREAVKAGDEKKAEALRKKMHKLGEGRKKLHDELMKQLADVLNDEQLAEVKKCFARHRRRFAHGLETLQQLDLTDKQKAEVKEILDAARKKAEKLDDVEEKKKVRRAAFQKIKTKVLTDEQRKRLETMKRRAGDRARDAFAKLDLSDKQKAEMNEISKAAHLRAAEAETHAQRREIMRDSFRKIVEDVLTDEQREQLRQGRRERFKKCRSKGPRGRSEEE
ncbi:MAG: Spy/CpxP family protein refolding chaperone [Planctomycetota bacterium]|nr:Spy/CpxP family protein refolding chaperone [Planctomycetota bacterium]